MADEHKQTSLENSRKLDLVITLLEGREDAPGVLAKLALHEEVLFGKRGNNGLVSKVNFMWRAHVWISCMISGVIGFLIRELLYKTAIKP